MQVLDEGPGIDFRILPKATLMTGFSTKRSLGVGFDIVLNLADQVVLATEPGRTTVVLEFSREGDRHMSLVIGGSRSFPATEQDNS